MQEKQEEKSETKSTPEEQDSESEGVSETPTVETNEEIEAKEEEESKRKAAEDKKYNEEADKEDETEGPEPKAGAKATVDGKDMIYDEKEKKWIEEQPVEKPKEKEVRPTEEQSATMENNDAYIVDEKKFDKQNPKMLLNKDGSISPNGFLNPLVNKQIVVELNSGPDVEGMLRTLVGSVEKAALFMKPNGGGDVTIFRNDIQGIKKKD